MKNKLRLFLLLSIILIVGLLNVAKAQDTVVTKNYHGKLDSINSDILKQKRLIQVFTPPGYKPGSTDKYNVLYVLDGGNWNTGLIIDLQHLLEGDGYMPPTIIVSVLGIDRNKDLTPTHTGDLKTSGGADKFLSFIKNELIPYVEKTYPSDGDNTLWGHSFGGLFVMYALLNEPRVFKSYIAVDPSFWWDKSYLPKIAGDKLPALTDLNASLFISGREGQGVKEMKIDTMDAILKKLAPAGLVWKSVAYSDETHGSVRLKSTYDGLKFTYSGFNRNIEFHPMNGIVLKDKPIKIRYFNDTTKVYYTLDGTEPTISSAKMRSEITLTGAVRVTNKYFASRSRYNKVTTGDFIIGKTLRLAPQQKDLKPGGFDYAYYEGKWDSLPDFKKLTPIQTGSTKTLDINKLPRQDNFALLISGQLETKEDGYYFFLLDADPGSKLYLGNKLLIQSDSIHTQRKSFILPLAKGFYPFRFEYIHKQGDRKLFLRYMTPAIMDAKKPVMIPFELQYGHN